MIKGGKSTLVIIATFLISLVAKADEYDDKIDALEYEYMMCVEIRGESACQERKRYTAQAIKNLVQQKHQVQNSSYESCMAEVMVEQRICSSSCGECTDLVCATTCVNKCSTEHTNAIRRCERLRN